MKQCCLCGKSGHESQECKWKPEVKVSTVGHAKHCLHGAVMWGLYKGVRAEIWYNSNQS